MHEKLFIHNVCSNVQKRKLSRNVILTFTIQTKKSFSHLLHFIFCLFIYFLEHLHLKTRHLTHKNSSSHYIYQVFSSSNR